MLTIALVCVWAGGFLYSLMVALAALVLAREWVAMCGRAPDDRLTFWMPVVLAAAALCSGLGAAGGGLVVLSLGMVAVAAVHGGRFASTSRGGSGRPSPGAVLSGRPSPGAVLSGQREPHHDDAVGDPAPPARATLSLAFGFPYLGLAAVALPRMRLDPVVGLANTLFVLSIVWASDIGAYLVGRLIGGPKLAPAISPGKTWSGAAGGLIGAGLAGMAVAACFSTGFSPLHVIELALGFGVISQAGDLLESALKRHFGVKDSGRIIPGHGGLLDRVDALLAVAPVAALLALIVGRGVVLWR